MNRITLLSLSMLFAVCSLRNTDKTKDKPSELNYGPQAPIDEVYDSSRIYFEDVRVEPVNGSTYDCRWSHIPEVGTLPPTPYKVNLWVIHIGQALEDVEVVSWLSDHRFRPATIHELQALRSELGTSFTTDREILTYPIAVVGSRGTRFEVNPNNSQCKHCFRAYLTLSSGTWYGKVEVPFTNMWRWSAQTRFLAVNRDDEVEVIVEEAKR